jgi:hypothetical protein
MLACFGFLIGLPKQETLRAATRIPMPTLIRLLIILLVLVGLAYGGMFALVAMVQPNEKQVTVRIPARDLVPAPERDPLVQREIDTSRTADSPAPVDAAPPTDTSADEAPADSPPGDEPAGEDGEVVTLSPGVE